MTSTSSIPIISSEEYTTLYQANQHHFDKLLYIVKQTNEPLEGNCFYHHLTTDIDPSLVNKQRNLVSIGQTGGNILEIGFNAGHSSLLFLLSNPENILTCIDICEHSYTKLCFEYLQTQFPNRIQLHPGHSHQILSKLAKENQEYDIIHIDGSHDLSTANVDFFMSKDLACNDTIIIWDDVWIHGLRDLWDGYVRDNFVKEFKLLSVESYSHAFGKIISTKLPPNTRIAVLSLTLGEDYKEKTKYGRRTKVMYCEKHGYDFYDDEDIHDTTRPPAWSKILLVSKYLPQYDYVVWMDGDTHVMNFEPKLQDIISKYSKNKDILVAQDWKSINTGVFFVKNTEWTIKFFKLIYDQVQHINHQHWEQEAFVDLLKCNISDAKNHIEVLPVHQQNTFNSYWYSYFFHDCFIIHFPACNHLHNGDGLVYMMNKFCPIQMDNESEESWKERVHWLEHSSREYIEHSLANQT